MTIPLSDKVDENIYMFPTSSQDFLRSIEKEPSEIILTVDDPRIESFVNEIKKQYATKKKAISIFILEDEPIYIESLKEMLETIDALKGKYKLHHFTSIEALPKLSDVSCDLFISDIDLGDSKMSGFDIVKKLRESNYSGHICVHSNRSSKFDFEHAIESGADSLIPKPMSCSNLLKLILDSSKKPR